MENHLLKKEMTISPDIVDDHVLLGQDYWLSKHKPELNFKNDLAHMDACGYLSHTSFVMPFPSSEGNSYRSENEAIFFAGRQHPNLVPVYAFNPLVSENPAAVSMLLDREERGGIIIWPILCGIDLHALISNKDFIGLLRKEEDNPHFFVEIHTGAGNEKDIGRVRQLGHYLPDDVVKVAAAFPKTKFILTHLLRLSLPALINAGSLGNVLIDTNGISSQKRWYEQGQNIFPARDAGCLAEMDSSEILEYLCHELGLGDKLSFGTSYPYSLWWGFDIEKEISLICGTNLSLLEKEKILFQNIRRFLPFLEGDNSLDTICKKPRGHESC